MGIKVSRPMINCAYDVFKKTGTVPIVEGIFKSYDAGFIIKTLQQKFNIDEINVDIARKPATNDQVMLGYRGDPINSEVVIIEITVPLDESYLKDEIEPFMNACGWYFSSMDKISDENVLIVFEKRLQEEEPKEYSDVSTLYHLTPISRLRKILDIGLTPKTHSKISYHPERIYLFPRELTHDELSYWICQLSAFEKEEVIKDGYAVLKIDRGKCNNIKIFADPNMDGAVFTMDNIPREAIEVIEKYRFKNRRL